MKKFLTLKWINCQKNNSLLILFIVLGLSVNLFAQKVIEVKGIKGIAYINGDVSPNEAKLQAINEAKLNALKAAGIGENIKSYQLLFSSEDKNDYSQFFSSDIQSEIQGAVQDYSIQNQITVQKNELELYVEVTINASVIKYDVKPDIAFDVNIEGIKAVYNNDSKLNFTIKTTKESYLTIFCISDVDATQLYPNEYEKQTQIKPLNVYSFPSSNFQYELHTDLPKSETLRLIFVFTKEAIPFIKMDKDQVTTNDAIFSWIYSIMPDQRKVEYHTLVIQK